MAEPIWKDYYVTLGTEDSYQYEIWIDGARVYEGVAHKRPGADNVSIKVNDVVADFLAVKYDGQLFMGGEAECAVYLVGELKDTELMKETFYNNWSYDELFNPAMIGLSCPINSRVMLSTPIPYSILNATELEVSWEMGLDYFYPSEEGRIYHYLIKYDYTGEPNELFFREYVSDAEIIYKVVDSCAKYALYYLNAYGGIDVLLMEGNYSEKDSLTRHTMEVEYDNRVISNRGRGDYAVELVKTLTLHTSWLSDDEASRMHHLLNSPQVFLFDIEKQQMIPVLLKNTSTEYKTYKGQGGKLVNYTIEVTIAQTRKRR